MKPNLKSARWNEIRRDPTFISEKQARYRAAVKHGFNKDYCASGYKKFSKSEILAYEKSLSE